MTIRIDAKRPDGTPVGYYLCSQKCYEADQKMIAEKYPDFLIEEVVEDMEPDTCTTCEECGESLECQSSCDEEGCEGREFWAEMNSYADAYYFG